MTNKTIEAPIVKSVCQTCGGDGYLDVPQTPGIDCPDCAPNPTPNSDVTNLPTLTQLACAEFTRAVARGTTAMLIMKDIQAYEPDDTPESVTISVQALEQILLQRLEDFHAAEGDALKLLKPPVDPMSATSAVADALVTDQVVGRVYHTPRPALAVVDLPAFDGYQAHIVRELQAAFVQACEKVNIKVKAPEVKS